MVQHPGIHGYPGFMSMQPFGGLLSQGGSKVKKEEKYKSATAQELTASLNTRLGEDKYVKHSMVARSKEGEMLCTAVPTGHGKMQCLLCSNQPTFAAGRSHCDTLKHLASPGHYATWYKANHPGAPLDKDALRESYNQFAHGTARSDCGCSVCKPPRPTKKRCALAMSVGTNGSVPWAASPNQPPNQQPYQQPDVGNLQSWQPGSASHANTKSF